MSDPEEYIPWAGSEDEQKVLTKEATLLAIQTLKDVIVALNQAFDEIRRSTNTTFRLLEELVPLLKEEPEKP